MGSHQPVTPNKQSQKPRGTSNRDCFIPKCACPWLVAAFLGLAVLHILCCSPAGTQRAVLDPVLQYINNTYSFVSSVPGEGRRCNYSEGQWVHAPGHGTRYNATLCNVKPSHNCILNGRPDTGYLDWRWQPDDCRLPAFDARAFLTNMRGKHVSFVGDSMARNQAQSLVCLLSASYPYRLLQRDPVPNHHNFWRYAFPSHGVQVSFYWAPFLVRATGNAEDLSLRYSHVHLDEPAARWAADAETFDVAVLAVSHWLLNGGVYYNGSEVIGAHNVPEPEFNHTSRVGYAWPYRMVYRKAMERLIGSGGTRPRTVVLTTFSPSHFEGNPIDSPTACSKMEPYKKGEKELDWIYKEVRDIVYEEAKAAKEKARDDQGGSPARIEVLDVTALAAMRPDGHPGVYRQRDPFANGVPERIISDCVHFCLPGPVDTFNEVLLQILKKRR